MSLWADFQTYTDGHGQREVHCHTRGGAGAELRTYLRAFRGVHKRYLYLHVATYEAMVNTKRGTPTLIQQRYVRDFAAYTGDT
jgi:hypothetical protein